MKLKKAKEQLMAISLLLSVFIFFIYLKMNPEINNDNQNISSTNTSHEIHITGSNYKAYSKYLSISS